MFLNFVLYVFVDMAVLLFGQTLQGYIYIDRLSNNQSVVELG